MKREITRKKFKFNFHFSDFFKELYIYRLCKEIKDVFILYLTTRKKENREYLKEWGFRVNTLGQPYTVINLPEDIAQQERDIEPYVVLQLRKMDAIFIKLKLTEIIYPDIERIKKDNPGRSESQYEDAFLVVLVTSMETFGFWKIFLHFLKYSIIGFLLWLGINFLIKSKVLNICYDFIKNYV